MAAFGADVKTPTRSNGAMNDKTPPPLGLLSVGSMTSTTALAGTTGTDVLLLHGDEWEEIQGNFTENIQKDHNGFVKGSENYKIQTNLIHRVNGTTNDTRVGVHNQTNIAPRNDTFMHTRSEVHHQPEHREQKTEDNEKTEKHNEEKKEHFAWNWYMVDGFFIRFEYNTTMNLEKKMLNASGNIFSLEGEATKVEMGAVKTTLKALATDIHGGKMKAAGTHLKAIAANINAGIAANLDSPFG